MPYTVTPSMSFFIAGLLPQLLGYSVLRWNRSGPSHYF